MISVSLMTKLASAEVHALTVDNFDAFIGENSKTLVKFYAPWCGHCKSMAKDYIEASELVPEGVAFAEVDVTEHKDIGTKYGVKGFPTLKYFVDGVAEEYDGGRKKKDLTSWVDARLAPEVTDVKSMEEAAALMKGIDKAYFVISYLTGSDTEKKVIVAAGKNRKLGRFFHLEGEEKLTVVRPDETVELSLDTKKMVKTIKDNRLPVFSELDTTQYSDIAANKRPMAWLAGSRKDFNKYYSAITKAAKPYAKDFNFLWMSSEDFAKNIPGMTGVEIKELPKMVVADSNPGKYRYGGNLDDAEGLGAFFRSIKGGSAERFFKSEVEPESNDGHVKIVVGTNFDQIVETAKDVLIANHAPWCGHCKKFIPVLESAAEQLKDSGVVFATIDGTANDVRDKAFAASSYPTILFKKAGKKNPVKFTGERTVAGIYEYLKKNASASMDVVNVDELSEEL